MGGRNLWSEQPLPPPADDIITGLEFLVDLSFSDPSWVSRRKERTGNGITQQSIINVLDIGEKIFYLIQ